MQPNRMSGYKYQALLAALLLLLIAYPVFRGPAGSPVLLKILMTVVFLVGGWVVFEERRRLAALLGGPPALAIWVESTQPDSGGTAVSAALHLSAVVFLLFLLVTLLRGVYRQKAVTRDGLAAVLCGYLILGVTFGHAYTLVEEVIPGSFTKPAHDTGAHHLFFLLTYFSFTTLTTLGYGDILPTGDTARALSVVEVIAGQFYLAVLVADLVGKRVAQALTPDGRQPD